MVDGPHGNLNLMYFNSKNHKYKLGVKPHNLTFNDSMYNIYSRLVVLFKFNISKKYV